MKKLLVSVLAILVLLIAGLLILPSFWDWNSEKARIAEEVRKLTGREIRIVGDVNLQLLPAPAFSARGVSLANIEGGSAEQMIQLDELQVQVALFPLLQRQILVETVTLVRPQVFLEVLADGRRNWDFDSRAPMQDGDGAGQLNGGPSGSGPLGSGGSARDGDAIRVDSFIIEDGTLLYRDAVGGVEERIVGLNAELAAGSLLGPFVASGNAAYKGVEGAFEVSLDRLRSEGATGLSLGLALAEAGPALRFSGAILRHQGALSLRGRLQGDGPSLSAAVARVSGAGGGIPQDAVLAQPFGLTAELTASAGEAEVAAMSLSLGELSLEGDGKILFGEIPEITANFTATRLDLDSLLPAAGRQDAGNQQNAAAAPPRGGDGAAPPSRQSGPSDLTFSMPDDVAADVTLSIDTLVYRGQFARDLRAAARLRDGQLAVEKLAAALPGGSELALTGTLKSLDQVPAFNGRVEAASDNLRALLTWLGVDLEAVPADRLRKMSVNSVIDANPQQVVLRDIDLDLDVSRITGGIAIALRERTGLGVGLAVDRINLDAYLPARPASTGKAPAGNGSAETPGTGTPDAPPASGRQEPAGFAVLDDFDANLDIRVGALTYQGLAVNGLRLDATLQQGGLVVREASLRDLGGSSGRFSGSLANVGREPSLDGSLDVSVTSLSRLIKALDLPSQGQLPLEAFTLSGSVNGNRQSIRFDQRLAALGGDLRAAGKADVSRGLPVLEGTVEVAHPDLSLLLRELLPGESIPGGLGVVDLTGQVVAVAQSIQVTAIEGKAAGVDLAGDLAVVFSGERPKVTADLRSGPLPLAALAAPLAGPSSGGKGAAPGSTKTPGANSAGRPDAKDERWSRKPIDLSGLRAVDAEITLQSEAILLEKVKLDKARLEAALNAGVLDLKRFTATVYGGALSVIGKADARQGAPGGLEVAAAVTAIDVDLRPLLKDLADTDRFAGPLTVESSLAATGNSEAALIGSLNGQGRIDGTVTVAAKAEEQAGALVLGILGQKVKEVRGISDSTALLFSAFAGAASKLDGTFVVEKGIVTTTDTKLRGRNAEALTAATVDLPTWQLKSQTDVFRDSDPAVAYLTAKLSGDLDSPDVTIGGRPFQRQPEPPSDAADPAATPLAPEQNSGGDGKAKPEEILKDGLKNLLRGLGG